MYAIDADAEGQGLVHRLQLERPRPRSRARMRYFVYNGGSPKYVARITEVAQKGYEGIVLTSAAPPLSGALLARGGNAVS
jgi:hypothetical protein